jgi:poly(3-hydroxybutyrate) depolymerase
MSCSSATCSTPWSSAPASTGIASTPRGCPTAAGSPPTWPATWRTASRPSCLVAGNYDSVTACAPQRPVSILEIHGTADATVAYDSVSDFLAGWAQRDGCTGGPALAQVAPGVERFDWAPCTGGTEVEHLRIDGGAHARPGATPPDPGPPAPISATREAWRFFAAHTRVA